MSSWDINIFLCSYVLISIFTIFDLFVTKSLYYNCIPSFVSDRQVGDDRSQVKQFDYEGSADFQMEGTVR